jgi:hypothetical protein
MSCWFRRQTACDGDAGTCGDCGEWLCGSALWYYNGDEYCEACVEAYDGPDDEAEYDGAHGDEAEGDDCGPACPWCADALAGTAYVVGRQPSRATMAA